MTDPPTFSLLDSPWIEATTGSGEPLTISLIDVFSGEHDLVEIRGDSPTQDYAVLRVLLAVYWRAHHPDAVVDPGETFFFPGWAQHQLEHAHEPDNQALEYLEKYRDRFDLLHPQAPFMQVAALTSGKDNAADIARIVPEAEADYFTMRAGDGVESVSMAEAARWVIHAHAFDYSGIKTGMQGDSRVKNGKGYPIGTGWSGMTGGTVILGSSLRETLVLNTTEAAIATSESQPVWERSPDFAGARGEKAPPDPALPTGPADFSTWQSRRIRLFTEGDRAVRVFVGNGDRIDDAGANAFGDPMTPYRYSVNKSRGGREVWYPSPYSADRTLWRSLEPLLVLEGDVKQEGKKKAPKRPETLNSLALLRDEIDVPAHIGIRLISMAYGPQSSSVAATVDRRLEIPTDLLHESSRRQRRAVLDAASSANEACTALGSYAGQLDVAAGRDYYSFDSGTADEMLGTLEPYFENWLRELNLDDLKAEQERWEKTVAEKVSEQARVLLRGAGPKALIGKEIVTEDSSRIVSAGTVYQWLQRKLRETLPLAYPPPEPSDTNKGAQIDDK